MYPPVWQVVPVSVAVPRKAAVVVAKDEFPRPDTTQDTLAKLRPAFVKVSTVHRQEQPVHITLGFRQCLWTLSFTAAVHISHGFPL